MIADEIEKLKRLLDQGAISAEEFARAKEKLLSGEAGQASSPLDRRCMRRAGQPDRDRKLDMAAWFHFVRIDFRLGLPHLFVVMVLRPARGSVVIYGKQS